MPTHPATPAPATIKQGTGFVQIIVQFSVAQYGALAAIAEADRCDAGPMAAKIIGEYLALRVRS